MEIWRLERDAEILEKKIKSLENDTDLMDYYLRTGDILYNYYEIKAILLHNLYIQELVPILAVLIDINTILIYF